MEKPSLGRGYFRPAMLFALLFVATSLSARTTRYRATWREDPARSIVIGFEQVSGTNVRLLYDTEDHGSNFQAYRFSAGPSATNNYARMRNVFVRIAGLQPATTYYFLIQDSEGISRRMSFETTPDNIRVPLSIIAGGDSRNNRLVAQKANRLVARIQPHFVLFGGDMTNNDTPAEWQAWFDDWQLTISQTGRLTPILAARGNHEERDASIHQLFDVPNPRIYYALNFGGGLLRSYTLNTLTAPTGDQAEWLDQDLSRTKARWKIVQYHHAMRPHTSSKRERDDLVYHWASRFYRYGVDLVVESDAHTCKQTYPIRPTREAGSSQSFIRDDQRGTVYVGEGCWGAPLRPNDDDKRWTRASARFNQFKWIWVDIRQVQVRTVRIDKSSASGLENIPAERFRTPVGVYLWDAPNGGDVLYIRKSETASGPAAPAAKVAPRPPTMNPATPPGGKPAAQLLTPDALMRVQIAFQQPAGGQTTILIADPNKRIVHKIELSARGPGPYSEKVQLPALPRRGKGHELVLRQGKTLLAIYKIQ